MFYAYYLIDEDEKGIVDSWEECNSKITNHSSRYKKFKTKEEAEKWLDDGAIYENKKEKLETMKEELDKDAVYFDAGTGRGIGVEVKITDYNGNSLLGFIIGHNKINEYGNFNLGKDKTNNYGELTGLYGALKYSLEYDIKKIAGDSELIIDKWSKGRYVIENLDTATIKLIERVILLRNEFESKGGKIYKISGDVNPADLGFHK